MRAAFTGAMRAAGLAPLGLAVALGSALQAIPPPPAGSQLDPAGIFRQAKTAANALPPLLAVKELEFIANEELSGAPGEALVDFRDLYDRVSQWPDVRDTAAQKARVELQLEVEESAIEAYAKRGRFAQALKWLETYDPGNRLGGWPDWAYGQVILQMLVQHHSDQVSAAIAQCMSEADGFPFSGADTAVSADALPYLERLEIATEGVQSASTTPQTIHAAKFLMQVHSTFPGLDSSVEDAAISQLRHSQADALRHPRNAEADRAGGSLLLVLVGELDPSRAASLRSEYPSASTEPSSHGVIELSSGGRVLGAGVGRGVASDLIATSSGQPGAALRRAASITDKDTRFAALAGIANSLAKSNPARANQAAGRAYLLLDKDVALAETGFSVELAQAFQTLGDESRSREVASVALDAADQHAHDAESQADISTDEGVERLVSQLNLASIGLSVPYQLVAEFEPAAALQHASACECKVMKPLLLANIAGVIAGGPLLVFRP
jgi:hypothetical protein